MKKAKKGDNNMREIADEIFLEIKERKSEYG